MPSHDTFSLLFRKLIPSEFGKVFNKFIEDYQRALTSDDDYQRAIAIDGKVVHRAVDKASQHNALNMVTAWAHDTRLSLGFAQSIKGGDE